MSDNLKVFVDCFRDGQLIRTYDFLIPASLASPPVPDHQKLIQDAKENLSSGSNLTLGARA